MAAESYEQMIPVGGVIPWLGEALGIPLPDNFAILDSSLVSKSVLAGSPFEGLLGNLPNMDNKSFYAVEDTAQVGVESGAESFEIELKKENLPTDYGLSFNTAPYQSIDNTKLSNANLTAAVGSGNGAADKYYVGVNLGREYGGSSVGGSGDRYLRQSKSSSEWTDKFPHYHNVEPYHIHNMKGTNKEVIVKKNLNYGSIGSGSRVTINTRVANNEVPSATCKFIIRLW